MAGHEAPPFWFRPPGWQAAALMPVAQIYGAVALKRLETARPPAVDCPVLCIGNPTVGGTGKTPTAIAIAGAAKKAGLKPGFLSRGYGSHHGKPHRVDASGDSARAVGDEALLLARVAPTVVSAKRFRGAQALVEAGVDLIIMDDGFQSRTVHYDFALLTLDARRSVGNGRVVPAGPLRAPLRDQLRHADALLVIGDDDTATPVIRMAARAAKPVHRARIVPVNVHALHGKRVLAFAGIGDPEKFFRTVRACGADLAATRIFGDHHTYKPNDARSLLDKARDEGLLLVTTAKDAVRLDYSEGPLAELKQSVYTLDITIEPGSPGDWNRVIEGTLKAYRARRITGSG